MGGQGKFLVAILLAMLLAEIIAKDTYCRNKFSNREDWIYCTKFGTATSARVRVRMRAKFLARYSHSPKIEMGIYRD